MARGNNSGPFIHAKLYENRVKTVFCYRTEYPCLGGILLREKGKSEARIIHTKPNFLSHDHEKTITGLQAGTEYEFHWLTFHEDGTYDIGDTTYSFRTGTPLTDFPLRDGPWLTNVDMTTATIGWRSSMPIPGGIIYREKGESEYREFLVHRNGQTLSDNVAQIVDLTVLAPDTEYEYKLACLDTATGTMRYHGDYSFRTFSASKKECRAVILSDTHSNFRFEEKALEFTNARASADFVAIIGDAVWEGLFLPNGDDLMENLVNPVIRSCGHAMPLVAMRGNHEWKGPRAADWNIWMSAQKGRCYRAFTDGPCFFICLDSGPIADIPRNRYFREIFEEQRDWICNEIIPSKAYRNAKFRIVMAHFSTFGYPGDDVFRGPFAETVLAPFSTTDPDKRIHLLISGHTHGYTRVDADSKIFYAMPDYDTPNRKPMLAGKPVPFPTVINDGPVCGPMEYSGLTFYANEKELVLAAFDQDMRVFDSFSVDRNGQTTTHPSVKRFE